MSCKKQQKIIVSKTWIGFVWLATKCFYLTTSPFNERLTEHNSLHLMGGRSRSNSVEEIALQVSSLDPPFAIFIDLCLCDFQVVESFTPHVNQIFDA